MFQWDLDTYSGTYRINDDLRKGLAPCSVLDAETLRSKVAQSKDKDRYFGGKKGKIGLGSINGMQRSII